ncbi:MAG: hypothetical protein NWE93_07295 [Candidatus Bathyarchaeota archaeon]|nr:hypothetical protein [Candidatus Bathyarchaeota archaeon]
MKGKVAVATVQGKTYFYLVNALKEHAIPFTSLIPGEAVPARVKLVLTTPQEQSKVLFEPLMVFRSEAELDQLMIEVMRVLHGKSAYNKIIVGIDPGEATGLAIIADGIVILEENCYSIHQTITNILKVMRTVNLAVTDVTVKIGNGVPVYREILEELDYALPPQVTLEVVGEAGTNRPLKEHRRSRKIRHISSAIRIAGRTGRQAMRRKTLEADHTAQ